MNRKGIADYLEFLGKRATELDSKKHPTEDDLRVVNREINKLLERLKESPNCDRQFFRDLSSLKFATDETKPTNHHWLRHGLIYGFLRFFPGAIVVHSKDKSDAGKRKKELTIFGSKVNQLLDDLDGYDIHPDV